MLLIKSLYCKARQGMTQNSGLAHWKRSWEGYQVHRNHARHHCVHAPCLLGLSSTLLTIKTNLKLFLHAQAASVQSRPYAIPNTTDHLEPAAPSLCLPELGLLSGKLGTHAAVELSACVASGGRPSHAHAQCGSLLLAAAVVAAAPGEGA